MNKFNGMIDKWNVDKNLRDKLNQELKRELKAKDTKRQTLNLLDKC